MVVAFAWFFAMYVITGTLIRLITMKNPDSRLTSALTFAH